MNEELKEKSIAALEALLNVSHRLAGCAMKPCIPCGENKRAITLAKKTLEELKK